MRRLPWWDVLLIVQPAVCALSASIMLIWGIRVVSSWRGWYYVSAAARSAFGLQLAVRAAFLWRLGQRVQALALAAAGLSVACYVVLRAALMVLAEAYALLAAYLLLSGTPAPAAP